MNSDTHNLSASRLAELLIKAKSGKEEALAELYKQYFDRIYRFIYYRTGHKETAEDLTEDVFVKAFKGISSLEQSATFEGWLYRIARNLVIDHYRSQKTIIGLDEVENTLEYETNLIDVADLQSRQQTLLKLMRGLTQEQQTVIKLKFFDDLENSVIAQMLNKSEGAIRVIQHRAILKLKELLEAKQSWISQNTF